MPITKRLTVHDNKVGMNQCLSYCEDPDKTDNGILTSGYNCHYEFALHEFMKNNVKYGTDKDDLSCYHVIQSFSTMDDITPEQAHEIGIKLCKELYTDFQCVINTHIDKGHLHNHIIVNATNTNGRKLIDRLSDQKEGLYALRAESDRISLEYGCAVIQNPPKIGKYKSKNYLYQITTANWKTIIIEKIDSLKAECDNIDDLFEKLSLEGYIIKGGKYKSIKPYGKDRFTRLKSIGSEYSEEALRNYFRQKGRKSIGDTFNTYSITNPNSELLKVCDKQALCSKNAILKSEGGMRTGASYPKYYNTRYQEKKEYNQLVKSIEFLNDNKIYSYDDLIDRLVDIEVQIKTTEKEYLKQKSFNMALQSKTEIAKLYISLYNQYAVYQEEKDLHGDAITETEEIKIFLDAKEQLEGAELKEVREILNEASKMKQELNKKYANISFLKHKASELSKLRMMSMDANPYYIKGMSFSDSMIDKKRSDEKHYCVRLPYTKKYVYLPRDCVVWKNYDKSAIMYLIDDEKYQLYDDCDNPLETVDGEELEKISKQEKEKVSAYYNDKLNE